MSIDEIINKFLSILTILAVSFIIISCIWIIILSITQKIEYETKSIQKGTVIESSCITKFYKISKGHSKRYYNVCRLKVKWDSNDTTIYNYDFPALPGDCIEQYDIISKYYYFYSIKYSDIYTKHYSRICEENE